MGALAAAGLVTLATTSCGGGEKDLRLATEADLGDIVLQEGDVVGPFNYFGLDFAGGNNDVYRVDFQPDSVDRSEGTLCISNEISIYPSVEDAVARFAELQQGIEKDAGTEGGYELLKPAALVETSIAFRVAQEEPFGCVTRVETAEWSTVAVQRSNLITFIVLWSVEAGGVEQTVSLANTQVERIESILTQ